MSEVRKIETIEEMFRRAAELEVSKPVRLLEDDFQSPGVSKYNWPPGGFELVDHDGANRISMDKADLAALVEWHKNQTWDDE